MKSICINTTYLFFVLCSHLMQNGWSIQFENLYVFLLNAFKISLITVTSICRSKKKIIDEHIVSLNIYAILCIVLNNAWFQIYADWSYGKKIYFHFSIWWTFMFNLTRKKNIKRKGLRVFNYFSWLNFTIFFFQCCWLSIFFWLKAQLSHPDLFRLLS